MGTSVLGCVIWERRGGKDKLRVTVAPGREVGGGSGVATALEADVPTLGSAVATDCRSGRKVERAKWESGIGNLTVGCVM